MIELNLVPTKIRRFSGKSFSGHSQERREREEEIFFFYDLWFFFFFISEALALWADAFYKSICPSVCPSVGRNPWGKVMERNGLRFEHFGIFLDIFEFLCFGWFFRFSKKMGFLGILGSPGNRASQWIRDLWSKGVSLILAYF